MTRILGPVPRMLAVSTTAVAFVLLLAACRDDDGSEERAGSITTAPTNTATTAEPSTTSTIEVSTTASQSGERSPGCINGWTTPTAGTPLRAEPLDLIRAQMGVGGEFHVVEM